jgi:anti-anti-sigma factor
VAEQLRVEVAGASPVVVRLTGDLDLNTTALLRDELRALASQSVVIDCRDLIFLDSSGIAMFVKLQGERELNGAELLLRNVTGTARRTLEICGLVETLGISEDEPPPAADL